ncbi:hypothetical protein [Cellulomonas sp.]|uniref:hypothetical protein n=1 Tax=Cellulomonas sp. TaxID=40001 RepID=UPI003BAB41F5
MNAVRRAAVADDARTVSLWLLDGNHVAGDLYVCAGFTRTGERQVLPRDASQTERYALTLRAVPAS